MVIKSGDSWHGQCRVVRAMRNNSNGAMLRMLSLMESRNCLLHLWTPLEWKWSQPTFSSMAIGRFLNRELRYQEGATSRCSSRQNWSTERAFHSPQCPKEMSQKDIWRNSRSLPTRLNISWFAAQKIGWTEETWIAMDKLTQENCSWCGEVVDVVGALTPFGSGVAQVFHDLLVELRLLLVAEVEEGEKEDRQVEGEEVKGGSQVEETTTTWMAMMMVVSGVRTRLELEANVSVDEVYEASETLRAYSGTVCGSARCEAPRNRWCAVSSSCQRRHWCSHCRAFRSACCCTLCRPNSHTVVVHPTLFP